MHGGGKRVLGSSVWSAQPRLLQDIDRRHGIRPEDPRIYSIAAYLTDLAEQHLAPSQLGAAEGGSYLGPGVSLFLYRFADEDRARSLERSGLNGAKCYRNGTLVLVILKGEDKVLPVFQRF
jgi:hypothetical protein